MITWEKGDGVGQTKAMADYSESIESLDIAYADRTFLNTDTNLSVKSQYHSGDYSFYRQNEAIPTEPREIMRQCSLAYKHVGLIRHIIDLMAEFGCQSITLKHPNKANQRFYDKWWGKVQGKHISERFLNMLYRLGNVPVYRTEAKIDRKTAKRWKSAFGGIDDIDVKNNTIPLSYYFLNPMMLQIMDPEYSRLTGDIKYRLSMSSKLMDVMKAGHTLRDQSMQIPVDLQNSILKNKFIDLDPDRLRMFFYKKDDWELWADPMIFSILDDIKIYNKMKLADKSALDGAISNIRLWRIGSLEHRLFPNRAAISKLRNILANNVAGGTVDIVWGPELDFKETNSQVHRFLGETKYEPVLNAIYDGVGIPASLRSSGGKGMTNNFISLKMLVERLQYGRDVLMSFWNAEIRRVQEAMGFKLPAEVCFEQMILGDESAEKRLLIELADRNIISLDTILERFDILPSIEKVKVFDDNRQREKGHLPEKASPYHNPEKDHELAKIALQSGNVTPSEVGLELEEKKAGEETVVDKQQKVQKELAKEKVAQQKFAPSAPNGRPKKSADKGKRKERVPKILTKGFVNDFIWATKAQKEIADFLLPIYLSGVGKKDIRALDTEQKAELEQVKLYVLSNTVPYSEITSENVYKVLEANSGIKDNIRESISELEQDFISSNSRQPNIEESRHIYASAYAMNIGENNG